MNYLVILLEMKNNALITIGFLIISNIIACQTENIKPASIMNEKKYNSLTKEEERVIVYKGTEYPLLESTTIIMKMEFICVEGVKLLSTPPKTNLNLTVVGLVLMMKL